MPFICAAGVVPALALPGRRSATPPSPTDRGQLRSLLFFALLLAFGTMALAFAGLLTHFVPMLREALSGWFGTARAQLDSE